MEGYKQYYDGTKSMIQGVIDEIKSMMSVASKLV